MPQETNCSTDACRRADIMSILRKPLHAGMKEDGMSPKKILIQLVLLCCTAALIAGCGEGGDPPPANPVIKGFAAAPALLSPGQSTTLTVNFSGGLGKIVSFGNNT